MSKSRLGLSVAFFLVALLLVLTVVRVALFSVQNRLALPGQAPGGAVYVPLLGGGTLPGEPVAQESGDHVPAHSPLATPTSPVTEEGGVSAPTVGPDGRFTTWPTWTPAPTITPRPTPTRRPGPTATPFPTRAPAADARGALLYVAAGEQAILSLPVDEQGRSRGVAVPLLPALDFEPFSVAPSPDGRYVLFLRPAMPGGIPYLYNVQSGAVERLSQRIVDPSFQENPDIEGYLSGWHPDGKQALFWSFDRALWLIDVESGATTTLAVFDGTLQGAAISPDGQEVVYIAGAGIRQMWKVSAASSDGRLLLEFGTGYVFGWSPDGQHILYMGGPGMNRAEDEGFALRGPLWLVDPEGRNPRPLAAPFRAGLGYRPVWSPDSRWVAFTGRDAGRENECSQKRRPPPVWPQCQYEGTGVYVEYIMTGEVRRLASGIAPVWSPDGSMLAFLSNQSGHPEVWTVRLDGSDLQQRTNAGREVRQVIWMPIP